MCKGFKDQAKRILHYIDYRIFSTKFNIGPSAVVSLNNLSEDYLFVPTGYDTKSMIQIQASQRSLDDPYEKYFIKPKQKRDSNSNKNKKYVKQSDDDNNFLKKLELE